MQRDWPLYPPPFSSCSDASALDEDARTEDLRVALKSLLVSYAATRSVLYLGLANFALDHYATELLRACCGPESAALASVDGEDLIVRPTAPGARRPEPSNVQVGLQMLQEVFDRFDRQCPGCKDAASIRAFVNERLCPYARLGYGLYRFYKSQKNGSLVLRHGESGWEYRGGCNCLARALMAALIAEHAHVQVDTCRVGFVGPPTAMRDVQAAALQHSPSGSSFHFACHHLAIQVPGSRLSPAERARWRVFRSRSTHRCESLYNFLILPLEWMIADALPGPGQNKLICPARGQSPEEQSLRARQYATMLLRLKRIVDGIIHESTSPYAKVASRLSHRFGVPQNLRRAIRRRERAATFSDQWRGPDSTDSEWSNDDSSLVDSEWDTSSIHSESSAHLESEPRA
jgi:hypothetical protein